MTLTWDDDYSDVDLHILEPGDDGERETPGETMEKSLTRYAWLSVGAAVVTVLTFVGISLQDRSQYLPANVEWNYLICDKY